MAAPTQPYFVGGLRFKSRTGRDPFSVVTDCTQRCIGENVTGTGLPLELPTGSGFYSVQPSLTWLFPSDPAVFFGSVSYLHNFKRNDVSRLVLGGEREFLGEIKPGGVFGFNFGIGLALNDKASFSLGYDHNSIARTRQNGVPVPGSVRTQLGTLLLGYSYRLSDKRTLNVVGRRRPDARHAGRLADGARSHHLLNPIGRPRRCRWPLRPSAARSHQRALSAALEARRFSITVEAVDTQRETSMKLVPLVETTRGYPSTGYVTENIHLGSVAVVDRAGKLLWSAGDPDVHDLHALGAQAIPGAAVPAGRRPCPLRPDLVRTGAAVRQPFRRTEAHQHGGSDPRQDRPRSTATSNAAATRRCTTTASTCRCRPSGAGARCTITVRASTAAFWPGAACTASRSAGYVDPAHPLQQAIRATLADTVQRDAAAMPAGLDGCSAPNYALPLSRLAHLYARLAQGAADPRLGAPLGDLFDAMTGHPDLVSGEARCDLAYMSAGAGDWVSKVGADAVQTIGIRSAGIGIAIKIADGATRSLQAATFSVLDQLGLLDTRRRALLEHYRQPALTNVRGRWSAMCGPCSRCGAPAEAAPLNPSPASASTPKARVSADRRRRRASGPHLPRRHREKMRGAFSGFLSAHAHHRRPIASPAARHRCMPATSARAFNLKGAHDCAQPSKFA